MVSPQQCLLLSIFENEHFSIELHYGFLNYDLCEKYFFYNIVKSYSELHTCPLYRVGNIILPYRGPWTTVAPILSPRQLIIDLASIPPEEEPNNPTFLAVT